MKISTLWHTRKGVALLISSACVSLLLLFTLRTLAQRAEIRPETPIVWVPTNPPVYVYELVIDPQQPSNIYAGGSSLESDIAYSRDYGETWRVPDTGPVGGSVEALAIDPVSPNYLYAALRTGHLARSHNSAQDWEQVGDRLFGNGDPSVIYVHPISPTLVLVGATAGEGPAIYRSTDRFDTWDVITLTYPINRTITQILHHPSAPQRLYAVVPDEGVFVSDDWGKGWANTGVDVDAMLIDPHNPEVMYKLDCTLYRSDDGGAQWQQMPFPEPYCFQNMYMDPQNSAYLYLGSMFRVPVRTLDGGQNWQMLYGYRAEAHPDSAVFAIDPQDSTRIYTGNLYRSALLDDVNHLPYFGR